MVSRLGQAHRQRRSREPSPSDVVYRINDPLETLEISSGILMSELPSAIASAYSAVDLVLSKVVRVLGHAEFSPPNSDPLRRGNRRFVPQKCDRFEGA
jgi:hypothetical protein